MEKSENRYVLLVTASILIFLMTFSSFEVYFIHNQGKNLESSMESIDKKIGNLDKNIGNLTENAEKSRLSADKQHKEILAFEESQNKSLGAIIEELGYQRIEASKSREKEFNILLSISNSLARQDILLKEISGNISVVKSEGLLTMESLSKIKDDMETLKGDIKLLTNLTREKNQVSKSLKEHDKIIFDGKYDYGGQLVSKEQVSKAKNAAVVLYFARYDERGQVHYSKGTGFIVEKNNKSYIITAYHWLSSTLASRVFIYQNQSLETLIADKKRDILVFKAPDALHGKGLPLGNSSEISEGMATWIVGNPSLFGTMIRNGIIANNEALDIVVEFNKQLFPGLSKNDIAMFSFPTIGGDSGSLVLAARDGRLEVIGFTQGSLYITVSFSYVNFGWMVKIDVFKEEI